MVTQDAFNYYAGENISLMSKVFFLVARHSVSDSRGGLNLRLRLITDL